MSKQPFPDAIYLDTNAIRIMGVLDPNASYLELKSWADESNRQIIIPNVVLLEWLNYNYNKLTEKISQSKSNNKDIQRLLNIKIPDLELPSNIPSQMIKVLRERLKLLGIKIAETPKDISIDELVEMAAFKTRPFEEKGEKGFRDTIILNTIISDMKGRKIKNSLFITNDAIFLHEDVIKIINKNSVDIKIVNDFQQGSEYIHQVADEHLKSLIAQGNKKLIDYLKTQSENIFKYVHEKAELSEDFIKKTGFLSSKQEIFGKIEKIVEFKPVEITSAFKKPQDMSKEKYSDYESPILITVKSHIKIIYSPINIFASPRVKVQDLDRFNEVLKSVNPRYYGDPKEEEIYREVTVSAVITKDKNGKYISLRLQDVMAF